MGLDKRYVEKELSWLSFNERVLQEAADHRVPIVERVRFLGIFSNNLDEYFRVRVANLKRRLIITKESSDDKTAKHLLSKIQNRVLKLQEDFDCIYIEVLKGLARHNIFLVNEQQISGEQGEWLRHYFRNKLLRYAEPIIVNEETKLSSVLKDDMTYLVVEMHSIEKVRYQYAVIPIPADDTPRFIQLPREKGKKRKNVMLLDNIIRYCLDDIFKAFFSYDSCTAYAMKMTRDADYDLSEDIDQSIVERMSTGLKQRLKAAPVRFVHDRDMPDLMVQFLKSRLGISGYDAVIPGGRYHNFRDFMGFPNIGRSYLENPKMPALTCRDFERHRNVFNAIKAKDILLYYPYHTFRHFTEFVRQASYDPAVEEIKICVYRMANPSLIISALISAVENGKKVTVVIELQARFDEEANIDWANMMSEAGIKVEFGVSVLKCHSKICLVTRREKSKMRRYVHIGTGNFHEKTAKVYTDLSLFTCHPEISEEVANTFEFIVYSYKRFAFQHLMVSPTDCRERIYRLIQKEIKNARKQKKAEMFIKLNNIDDHSVINMLYEASQAGVKIRMIIRGMCSLVPGIEGLSDNIKVISIVDQFLEHARVAVFHNGGDPKVFISSADWMTRNIDRRVEVGCPIYDEDIKQRIIDLLELQWSDTTKARIVDREQSNHYKPRGNKRKIRSQVTTYEYLKALEHSNQ